MPFTVKRSLELLGICLVGVIIVVGKTLVMPLLLAFFISLLLMPMYRFFKRIKFPDVLAIITAIVILAIGILLVAWFFSHQIALLVSDFPQIQKNVTVHLQSLSSWIQEKTNVSTQQQVAVLNEQSSKMLNNVGGMLGGAAVTLSGIFIFFGLLPIYIFLIMYYKNLLLRFIFLWFSEEDHPQVEDGLKATQVIVKSYLIGLLIQITYLTILVGGILMLIGIKHAILIGVIFAILNLIPYVGALVGNVIGVALTLSSSQELWHIWAVLGVIALVQFLDNNILMPRIVGSKVKINALVAIVGVIIGGTMAGIAGMFLSLPVIATLKIIFDRAGPFKQWGVLLGDENPPLSPMSNPALRLKNKHIRNAEKKDELT